ncbi:hypothetical protein VPH35_122976 [Triticum aestivum]
MAPWMWVVVLLLPARSSKKRREREAVGSRGCCCLLASGFPGEEREREKFRETKKELVGGRDHGKERDGAHLLAAGAVLGEELDAAAGWLLGQEEGGVEGDSWVDGQNEVDLGRSQGEW